MKRLITAEFLIIAFMLSSCYVRFPENVPRPEVTPAISPSPVTTPEIIPGVVDSLGQVEFRRILSGEKSSVNQYEVKTIEDDSDFQSLWNDHTGSDTNPLFLPNVDFELKKVLAIFLGDRPTTGYSVEVYKITETSENITVHFKEVKPIAGDTVKAEITQPFLIIEVKRTDKPFIFDNPNLNKTNIVNMAFDTIESGTDSGIKDFTSVTAKTEDEFTRFYRNHLANQKVVTSSVFPKVDFNKNIVAAIFLGTRLGQGYSIEVQSVQKTDTQIIISAREVVSDDTSVNSSSPYIMITLPKSDLPVKFDIDLVVPPVGAINNENEPVKNLEIRPLFLGERSGVVSSNFIIIQNRSEFLQWWNRHNLFTNEPPPEIDFGNNTMVASFLGNRDNNVTVNISSVVETTNDVRIFVDISESSIISVSRSIQPYSIILIPKIFKQGTFIINNITK